ncbi:SMP-30/gluconolactonase/LRE family protein, partial [Cyanobium sp. BA20m-14]|uniref:SMP-30/gluconolactonase/LRE family protein n=1 Tax=Cyanobium sp. BA20m-14 TaxID=2823703 RepID=UPI0020CF5665
MSIYWSVPSEVKLKIRLLVRAFAIVHRTDHGVSLRREGDPSRILLLLLRSLMHTQPVTVMRTQSKDELMQATHSVGLVPCVLTCGIATASLALTTSALALEVPTGVACLPTSAVAPLCRELVITNNPPYPGSQSPQLPVQSFDPAFTEIVGRIPDLVPLATGFGFLEGPAYVQERRGDGGWLFITDQIHNSIFVVRWKGLDARGAITPASWEKPRLFRNPSGVADGQTLDQQGHLLIAETTGRRISITRDLQANLRSTDPQAPSLVDRYQGKRFNSPNDLVVKSDGSVWFTDPSYGSLQFPQTAELPNNVYRYEPSSNSLTVVEPSLMMPNGIAFGPGEKLLYLIDSG